VRKIAKMPGKAEIVHPQLREKLEQMEIEVWHQNINFN
jgi:hypothetical protein